MKYRHSLRNGLVVAGGLSAFAGSKIRRLDLPDAVPIALIVLGLLALGAAAWVALREGKVYGNALAKDVPRWRWNNAPIPDWVNEVRAFPLTGTSATKVEACMSGLARGVWVNLLFVSVRARGRTVSGTREFQVMGFPVQDWVPRVQMMPVGRVKGAYAMVGGSSIEFESAAFSAVWHVRGEDARKVHDVVHPRAMERLLQADARDVPIIIDGGAIWTWRAKFAAGDEFERIMRVLYEFAMAIPVHLDEESSGILVPRWSNTMVDDIRRANASRPPSDPLVARG